MFDRVYLPLVLTLATPWLAQAQTVEPDGNDATTDTGSGPLPTTGHWEGVGRPPQSLYRICDLRVFDDALYLAHARAPLGSDGATITRYQPEGAPAFRVAFDWNRPGQPTAGGGAGQGFLRIRAIDGRLFVPDSDAPYAGFGFVDAATEGYVYVSARDGRFAPARGPRLVPPGPPDAVDRAGAGVVPRGYHIFDVVRFRGHLYATTGSVPPHEHAWTGPSPGALHLANAGLDRWTYTVDYPHPWQRGVWRLTFAVRFRDRLFAGIQDYDWREPNDYVVIAPPSGIDVPREEDVRGVRVTAGGGAQTVRWYADAGRLYWIALERGWTTTLRVTDDGEHWTALATPAEGGRVLDVTRFRGALVVLTERGLYRLDPASTTFTVIATVTTARSPFALGDLFCAAPLAVYRNVLYAGGQDRGRLYRLVEGTPP